MSPLVSGIMPTRGRPEFAYVAVNLFQAQSWGNKELVIVDDPKDPSFPDGCNAEGVSYYRHTADTLGAKRNFAVSKTSGEIIVHWDDDDCYHADRIKHQVELLLARNVDIVAYHTMVFKDLDTDELFIFRGDSDYAIGTSFCYWRDAWVRKPYPSRSEGEDWSFRLGRRVYSCHAEDYIIGSIHSGCTVDRRHIVAISNRWEKVTLLNGKVNEHI